MVPAHHQNRLVRRLLEKEFENPPPTPRIPNVVTYHPGTYNRRVYELSGGLISQEPTTSTPYWRRQSPRPVVIVPGFLGSCKRNL